MRASTVLVWLAGPIVGFAGGVAAYSRTTADSGTTASSQTTVDPTLLERTQSIEHKLDALARSVASLQARGSSPCAEKTNKDAANAPASQTAAFSSALTRLAAAEKAGVWTAADTEALRPFVAELSSSEIDEFMRRYSMRINSGALRAERPGPPL